MNVRHLGCHIEGLAAKYDVAVHKLYTLAGLPRSGKSQGKTKNFKAREKSGNLTSLSKSVKSQGIIFLSKKHHRNDRFEWRLQESSFDQWFPVYFIIHCANLRSVKIVQKSVKIQGILLLLMSGNAESVGDLKLTIVSMLSSLYESYLVSTQHGIINWLYRLNAIFEDSLS